MKSQKVKLVFLFMRHGAATYGSYPDDWEPSCNCADYYYSDFAKEGYFQLLQRLMDDGVIDDLKIFYESNRNPGWVDWVSHPNAMGIVTPELRLAEKYIDDDTIIWVRGGFKQWHDVLKKYKGNNWLLLYAANTGRQKWEWWDVVFDDIDMSFHFDRHGRLWLPFIKPIDDSFFVPIHKEYKWDVCVGASHIHDKKGQWRIQNIIDNLPGRDLKVIVPGAPRRGVKTTQFINWADRNGICLPGHVHRNELVDIFSQSKCAVFLGAHGQNDRGPLEALSCGTPCIIMNSKYNTKSLHKIKDDLVKFMHGNLFFEDDSLDIVANDILHFIETIENSDRPYRLKKQIAAKYREHLGFEKSCTQMKDLLLSIAGRKPTAIVKEEIARSEYAKKWRLNDHIRQK